MAPKMAVVAAMLLGVWLAACASPESTPIPTPTLSTQAFAGKAVFVQQCGACHSTAEETVIVGPSLAGIATAAAKRVPGQDARTYLYTAILDPGQFLLEGYEDLMPNNFGKELTGEELDAVVVYLLTLE